MAYSPLQITVASLLGGFWGWAGVALPIPLHTLAFEHWERGVNQLILVSVIGLPIATFVALTFVRSGLKRLLHGDVSYRTTVYGSLVISGSFVLATIVLGRFLGLLQYFGGGQSQVGGGDFIRSIDGILTPYGWWILAQNSLLFIGWCVVGAVIIRTILPPGTHRKIGLS